MSKNLLIGIVMLCFLSCFAYAYQQGNIVFDAHGWNISDQYSNRQAFTKNGLFLEVRASTGRFIDTYQFAADIGAKVESEQNGSNYEAIIVGKDIFYIFERRPYENTVYLITMSGDPKLLSTGKTEMKKILDSVSFSASSAVVEAPWEKPLKAPEELPFLQRHPIPWGWVVFWVIVGLLVWWKTRKWRKKGREQRKDVIEKLKKEKDQKKDKDKEKEKDS